MRARLRTALRTLLDDPALQGLADAARLAAVMLYAKSRAPRGTSDDLLASIWGAELGRWLGKSASTVHHHVLPALRATGALHTRVATNPKGHPTDTARQRTAQHLLTTRLQRLRALTTAGPPPAARPPQAHPAAPVPATGPGAAPSPMPHTPHEKNRGGQ
ncbi:hypothetical protein H9Y04_40835 [Streptomyces sp. TRM66268-LWL]|uniref:Uncharacterized protein n=1 Tax=Streptomyces polyasparticus TaxID=2767826 RepID=A0ABR7SU12_9ACTN|nr:hypothetical protein [Streptomyces polyasparticus]MBC9718893.1 hypothetical protein [Streptomyces polyasparticus]